MQKYNQHKNVKVYDKNANNVEQDSSVGSRELDFIKANPILFIILEWGALAAANANWSGLILGTILSIAAVIGGYEYSKISKVHGSIMLVFAIIVLIVQF
ncbi:hypothetical protein [Latilactobacillus fuchuensis]|uniref:hypothetical protein n=1 Tax=Latilactobacillus fuchuensis TaxID=164393 RepID=UPI0039B06A74